MNLNDIDNELSPTFKVIMNITLVLIFLIVLSGCTALDPEANARSLLDRLEFDDDEYGHFSLVGDLDLNPLPFFTTNVHMELEKTKDKPAE